MSHPTVPYVTVAEFTAHPTFLDLDNLRVGDSAITDQQDALNELLLKASSWARDTCDQPLHAHVLTEQRRLAADRYGRVKFTPAHGPVRQVTGLSYGSTIGTLTALTAPVAWIDGTGHEPQNAVTVELSGPQAGAWVGSLQFGGPVPGGQLYVRWTTVCGYSNTTVATDTTAAATALPLADVTGVQPGDTLRICDPGSEEAITVADTWNPTTGPASIPLTGGLVSAHKAAAGVSAIPGDAKLAVINYTAALLLRPDSGSGDPFADAPVSPTTRNADPRRSGTGLVAEARRLLTSFGRVPR